MKTRHMFWRCGTLVLVALLAFGARASLPVAAAGEAATPTPEWTCADVAMPGMGMPMGTPMAGMGQGGMPMMGTPGAIRGVEFDQLYIDMMIAHHAAIVAMARVAEPHLTDVRLREIALAIVDTQVPEIEELRDLRERFYGSPDPLPMDAGMMGMMGRMMPGMGSMEEMAFQMDARGQVAAICAAADPDLAFIDLTIPHHAMAIVSSEIALRQTTHPEIRDFARRVVDAQQGEIEVLAQVRAELTGAATPAASRWGH
jgi:uncharacterized protein (DUF305 family)